MPRVSEISDAGGDPILEHVFATERRQCGELLNPTKVLAHCPPLLSAMKTLYAAFQKSGLVSGALLALVYVRVSSINGCPF